ncbi:MULTISPECIES: peptidoglycan-binding protein [unclassified Streptomyces]|uniref:peptidoglycan-binding domain-containing protein n=1 Tax=unclassified Streptomyces TaxID=2593676 RepID=UPI002F909E67
MVECPGTGGAGHFQEGDPDGKFAERASHGLTADGIIGPNTWNKLTQTVRTGSSGPAVKAAQAQLAGYGNRIAVDGAFGPATRKAAMAFQRPHGLTADGIIGTKTSTRPRLPRPRPLRRMAG